MGATPMGSTSSRIATPRLRRRRSLHGGDCRPKVASGAERALGAASASERTSRVVLLHVLHNDVHGDGWLDLVVELPQPSCRCGRLGTGWLRAVCAVVAPSGRALHCSFTTSCVYENVHGMAQRDVIVNLTNAPQPLAATSHANKQTDRQTLTVTHAYCGSLQALRPISAHSSRVSASIGADPSTGSANP